MPSIRRLPITLLEVMIVIAILSMAAGIVAVSVNKALINQRFRTEVDRVVDELRLAQDLMLILENDVHLRFGVDPNGNGIIYSLKLETKLPKKVEYEILRKKAPLKTIKGVFFADELATKITEKQIDIKFLSNGAVMSKGIIRLASSDDENVPKGTLESFICLAGYPRPIAASDTKEDAEKKCLKFEEGFDERITQDTISRLPENLKQPDAPKENENPKDNGDSSDSNDKADGKKDGSAKGKKTIEKNEQGP